MLTSAELARTCATILAATVPEAIFGKKLAQADLNAKYRELAKIVHPDKHAATPLAGAAMQAFRHLTAMRDMADTKFAERTYGDMKPPKPPAPPRPPLVVKVKGTTYTVGDLLVRGDVADLYRCEAGGNSLVLKLAKRAADNDLLQNEAKRLAVLNPKGATDIHARYVYRLIDSFLLKGEKSSRQANVFKHYPEHVTLEAIHKHYPDGLDYRDVMWMLRRMLEVLGYVHDKGIIHGAVLPPHLLVHPVKHGAKLIGWGCAVDVGTPLKALSAIWKSFYPPEVLAKRPLGPATDLYMASKTALWLIGDSGAPRPLTDFLRANLLAERTRFQDAWVMHDALSVLLKKLVGEPKYRKLELPQQQV